MFGLRETDDCRPVTWVGRMPVYLTTILVALYAAASMATTIASSAGADLSSLLLSPSALLAGAVWQPFTYTFVEPVSFFTAFNLLFLYLMGVQVEMYLGRRRFSLLFLSILVIPALFFTFYYWNAVGTVSGGAFFVSVGFFIAFATLYPNTQPFGFIPMKWLAAVGLILSGMAYVGDHNWPRLTVLLLVAGASFGYVRMLQLGGFREVSTSVMERLKPKPRVVLPFRTPAKTKAPQTSEEDVIESIDPLLDKISEHGLESLTPKEKEKLERARLALLKKH